MLIKQAGSKLLLSAIVLTGFVRSANAGPACGLTIHRTLVPVPLCVTQAQAAIKKVAGVTPTTFTVDANTVWVYAGSVNDSIFAICTASPVDVCPSTPEADISIEACSSLSVADSANITNAV